MADRTMMHEEAVFVIADLLGYRGPLRVDVFRLADDTLEARLCVDPDVAFAALTRRALTDANTTDQSRPLRPD